MALKFSIGNFYETYSENEELQKGDVIKKIDDYDARDVRHVDAQNLLQNSESVKLVVERSEPIGESPSSRTPSRTPSRTSSRNHTPQLPVVESNVDEIKAAVDSLPKVTKPKVLPKSPVPPVEEYRAYSPDYFNPPHDHLDEVREERVYLEQPYRTTPLVLPGAKVKKDAPLGECYLRHHPNPMIRASPHHYEVAHPEVAMKQKVAETVLQRVLGPNDVPKVVHKQFNSPIGLYSEQNIADTIKCQTSAVPALKKPLKYDPSKSEAYKALQEEALGDNVQEVRQPVRTGVFSPHKANQNRVPQPSPKSPGVAYVNAISDDGEKIHQSNSFKRIMYSVLGQTDY